MRYLLFVLLSVSAGACVYAVSLLVQGRLAELSARRRAVSLEDILRDRTLCFLTFALASLVFATALTPWLLVLLLPASFVLSARAGHMLDKRAKTQLLQACNEELDVMADIVAMGVKAGLSFDAALELYCSKFDCELSRLMHGAYLQWTSGMASREKALSDLASQLGSASLRRFNETVVQAIRFGSPLADMLIGFAEEARRERHVAIERQVAKAPVKMLVPTGTCILPAMLILVMGPVLLQFAESGI